MITKNARYVLVSLYMSCCFFTVKLWSLKRAPLTKFCMESTAELSQTDCGENVSMGPNQHLGITTSIKAKLIDATYPGRLNRALRVT